jgi:hypothetical protein
LITEKDRLRAEISELEIKKSMLMKEKEEENEKLKTKETKMSK